MDRRRFLSISLASAVAPAAHAMMPLSNEPASVAPADTETPDAVAAEKIDFTSNLPAAGSFPAKWICGSPSCMDNQDPPVQVHWYNEHTAFLRQNKAYSYEAPFLLLYFGNDRILFVDQGFTQLRTDWDLRDVVDDCIAKWCKGHGRKPEEMELL
ncbi:MAG TPA: hydrolase glyoxylase, partial [Acidobacteriaceae bacterium]